MPASTADLPAGAARALDRHGVRVTAAAGRGASCTRLYRARGTGGAELMVKLLHAGRGRVDGHDVATFRRKRHQLERLRALEPRLADCHVPIVAEIRGTGWVGHVMPYVDGHDALAPARAPAPRAPGEPTAANAADAAGARAAGGVPAAGGADAVEAAAAGIGAVLGTLAEVGYAALARPYRGDYLSRAHLDRVDRRLGFLAPPVIPAEAYHGSGIEVNGVRCVPLVPLLAAVAGSARLRALLQPRLLSAPVHGDLNTRNVLLCRPGGGRRFALVDPRGTLRPVDAVYDLAKLALSVTLWDPLLRYPPSVRPTDRAGTGWRVRVPVPAGYRGVLGRLPGVFEAAGPLGDLLADSGAWRVRLAFSHAMHAIAEAACRISDGGCDGSREGCCEGGAGRPHPHPGSVDAARAFFYVGLLLLNHVVTEADGLDLAEHWRLLDGVHRPRPPDGG